MLSDTVAAEVVRLRRAAGLTRDDLSARCAERGLPLSTPTIAGIETGRPGADGKRRREVSVDELAILADALGVAPVLLVFPVGQRETTEYVNGADVPTWNAAQWFGGHGDRPVASADAEANRVYRMPVGIFGQYDGALRQLRQARGNVKNLTARVAAGENGDTEKTLQLASQNVLQIEGVVRSLRGLMRAHGITPPTLAKSEEELETAEAFPTVDDFPSAEGLYR